MNLQNRPDRQGEVVIFGKLAWIADELIGIRAVEQRLCEEIGSAAVRDHDELLSRINDLRGRVNNLDRALDEYTRRKAPRAPAKAAARTRIAGLATARRS